MPDQRLSSNGCKPVLGWGAVWCLLLTGLVQAQTAYPSRPVSLVVPFPPGGSTDIVARAIAPKLGERLGTSVVVDNRPGAGTAIGAAHVAKAAADGYTLLMGAGSTLTLNPAVRKNLPYDPVKSFDPVGMISRTGLVLVASLRRPSAPWPNWRRPPRRHRASGPTPLLALEPVRTLPPKWLSTPWACNSLMCPTKAAPRP